MRPALWLALAAAALVASPASAGTASAPSRHFGSVAPAPDEVAGPLSWLTRLFPNVKPYPPGEGDADGLSRNIEDCNKGCIGNPIR